MCFIRELTLSDPIARQAVRISACKRKSYFFVSKNMYILIAVKLDTPYQTPNNTK